MYRGNLQNTGVYDTRAARYFGEQPNWTFQAQSPITCSPVVADGLVFFGTEDGNLFALDARTGTERWRFFLRGPVSNPPEIFGGTVYCVLPFFGLTTINARSGVEIPLRGEIADLVSPSPLAVREGAIYVSAESGHHAIDVSTGEIIRSFDIEGFGFWRPVVGSATVSFGGPPWVEVVGLENGESRNRLESGNSWFVNEICLHNDSLYFFVWQGYHLTEDNETLPRFLMALTTGGGFDRHYMELPQDSRTAPAADAGIIYFGGVSGRFYAIDIQAVAMKWEFAAGASIQSSPSIAEDLIYFGCDDGALYVVNKETGALVQRLRTESGLPIRTSPALCDGVVYFADTGGSLYSWGSADDTSGINKIVVV